MQVSVNNETLKPIAEKLVARLNDMGVVTKTGKPLVVDQGFEAIAAVFGYRNQHVLRQALKQPENQLQCTTNVLADNAYKQELLERFGYRFELEHGLDAWVVTFNGDELQPVHTSQVFAVEQIWSDVVIATKAARSVSDATWKAMSLLDQEGMVCDYLKSVGWSSDLIPQLKAAGYALCYSDFKRPYWERDSEASEDFDTEAQAWIDAWHHAKSHFVKLEPASQSMEAAVKELVDTWADGDVWGEHPHYDRSSWRHEVSNEDTNLGYWEWVVHQIEANDGPDEHCSCGAPLNDGEGFDGLCGNCADKASCSECGEALPEGNEGCVCPDCQIAPADIDRRTRTAYSFSIGALSRDNLLSECADQGIYTDDLEREPSDELRAMLLEHFDNALRQAAEAALSEYFDNCAEVIAAYSGWETSEVGNSTLMRRAVFLENPAMPEADSRKVMFNVELVGFKAESSSIDK